MEEGCCRLHKDTLLLGMEVKGLSPVDCTLNKPGLRRGKSGHLLRTQSWICDEMGKSVALRENPHKVDSKTDLRA